MYINRAAGVLHLFYEGDDHAFVHRLRSRSVPVNLSLWRLRRRRLPLQRLRLQRRSGLAGPLHLRVEVCPRHHLRLAGRGAVQAGIGNTRLLRQAIGIGRPEASTDAIGLDHLKVCLPVARSPKLPRHARPG